MRKLPRSLENPIDTLCVDLAEAMSPALKATGHTPNVITTYSAGSAALAVYALHRGNLRVFSALWMLQYFWDCVDGHFARKYGMVTTWGDGYDHVTDVAGTLALVVVVLRRYTVPPWVMAVGAVVMLFNMMNLGCQQRYVHARNGAARRESLDSLQPLCPGDDPGWLWWTALFSHGTTHLAIVLLVWYLEKHHKKPGV